ncbi:SDR family oxidoreductase [Jonesiaceae bacterium BS-20]|uniref:SDR family oxidoreductase n=1 Tax=Jonesiaceae bacterium BS-20 TaxID=3120821 RepID=A0AAU7DW77_9MICO
MNTFGPLLALQGARTVMASGGAVVLTSSTGARSPIATSVPYSMSKAAVNMLVAAGAGQLLDAGIRVNVVASVIVDTPLQTRQLIAAMSRQGVVGTPQDIARAVWSPS